MIFNLFKCKHKAKYLAVKKMHTMQKGLTDRHFDHYTYHLFCTNCGEDVDVEFADINIPIDEWLDHKDHDNKPTPWRTALHSNKID